MRRCSVLICGVVLALFTACSWADPPLEMVVRTKQATAFVTVEVADGVDEGSAFCIDTSGLFVTNAHVVGDLKPGGRLTLILHSGESDQVIMLANVVKLDKGKDLAILQAAHPRNLTALQLGKTDGLVETMPVVAFGYPFGTDLALKDGDYPSITVSTGHITALRKLDGDLASIQLDASLNEGNSGGPIIDSKGDVIAIVKEGIPGAGSFAIGNGLRGPQDMMFGADGLATPLSLTFGPNGKLYVGDKTSTIKRFDSRTGAFLDVFAGGNGMVYPMRILLR